MTKHFVDLKDLAGDKIALEGTFSPGEIEYGNEGIRQTAALDWSATAQRAGPEIRIAGALKTSVETSCGRCLEPARLEISKQFDLFFRQRQELMYDEDEEIELTDEDTRTAFFTGTQLAIADVLREQILLSVPMKVLCKPECRGLCPVCGTNWNVNTCNCSGERFSPHLDQLLEIKRKLEERSS
jgi:uncharacterized protein